MEAKGVSIIIPTFNEEKLIGQCLDSLARLQSPCESFEVIVVDNGSIDHTLDIAQSFSEILNLTTLEKMDVHVSALRNLGASRARGAVFAFLDADCIVPPKWLNQAKTLLNRKGVGVVGAHFRIPQDAGWVARVWYGKLNAEKQGILAWVPACNTWVCREVFEGVGGFDESIETNEDCEFCSRVRAAGYQIIGDSRIAVLHLGTPEDLRSFYRKNCWHATDGLRVFLRDPMAYTDSRPVLFGFYTLICLVSLAIGVALAAWKKRIDVISVSLGALLLPSFLLSLRLTIKRKQWTDLFPLTLLHLVYGFARGRSLLILKNWNGCGDRLRMATPVLLLLLLYPIYCVLPASAAQGLTAIWANTGEDKVTRDELRATNGTNVKNSVWDGAKISIFGGRNEVVAFNVILEAGSGGASNVTVSFNSLTGPSGSKISSTQTTGDGVFSWTGRNIELFYVRYLQINGLSLVSYPTNVDERQIPQRFQRPWSGNGVASGGWTSRPDHNKFYPEIAIPLELVPSFNITGGQNQSIWVDVYIPKTAIPGNYAGQILVQVNGGTPTALPIFLQVYNFTLPDTPNAKTMLIFDSANINQRFLGSTYVAPDSAAGTKASLLRNRYFMLAHRHRISLIGDNPGSDCDSPGDQPCPDWEPRLNGSLFTTANGYDGPGVGVGNNIYSIGTYGNWSWNTGTQADMNTHTDNWATWFNQNAPGVDYFLYLDDESTNDTQTQTWAQWILNNPGPGNQVRSMATLSLVTAASQTPLLDIPTSTLWEGVTSQWQSLANTYTNDTRKRFYMYNGHRPASGSFATEDDGIALRELAWGQYKKHINRWYFWESTYYNNIQGSMGQTNVFETAQTFGTNSTVDPILGATGWNYSNGDGVLLYPGTDILFPTDSYGVEGPFASLRLKSWRRGVQDVDYLTMAAAIDPTATQNIVNQMVPKVLWEYGVDNSADPTYVHTAISWSNDSSVWEAARAQLAAIITGSSGQMVAPGLNLPSMLPVNAQISASYPSGYTLSGYQWSIVSSIPPVGSQTQISRSATTSTSTPATISFKTAGGTAQLAPLNLPLGYYEIAVTVTDASGNVSPPAFAYVTLLASDLSAVRIYPNPWRADRHSNTPITFDHLSEGATIKIFTVSGHLAKSLNSTGGIATWDLSNDSGERVASGIYLYVVKTTDNQTSRGQLAIIR